MRLARDLGAVGSRYQNSLLFHMNNAFEHDPAEARDDAIAFIPALTARHVRPYTDMVEQRHRYRAATAYRPRLR